MTDITVYGHDITLEEPEDGEYVTHVFILARSVPINPGVDDEDTLLASRSFGTTSTIRRGLLANADDMEREVE